MYLNRIYTANFSKPGTAASGSAVTSGAVSAENKDDRIVINGVGYKIEEGTFTITGKYKNRNIIPTTVNVSVKNNAPTIKVKYAAINSNVGTYENDIINALEVSDSGKYTIIALADVVNNPTQGGTSLVLVRKVKVAERVADGKYVIHTVDLNQYFTVNLQ